MQVEIDFPGHPFLDAFCQKRGDKPQAGCRVGKDDAASGHGCHAGPAFDPVVDSFETVGRAQTAKEISGRTHQRRAGSTASKTTGHMAFATQPMPT